MSDIERALRNAMLTGNELDLSAADAKTLPASAIRDLLLDRDNSITSMTIRGASITGRLQLEQRQLPVISFFDCTFDDYIMLSDASVRALTLANCDLVGVVAPTLALDGTLRLSACRITEQLDLTGARISGRLILEDSRIGTGSTTPGLAGDDLLVGGTIDASRLKATEVLLGSSSIGGHLRLRGATLLGANGDALDATGMRVEGGVDMRPDGEKQFVSQGRVSLIGASVGSHFLLGGARLINPDELALDADFLTVRETIDATPVKQHRTEIRGAVSLSRAKAKSIALGGALVESDNEPALILSGVDVESDLFCNAIGETRCEVLGGVAMDQARVGGQLSFDGAHLKGTTVAALSGDGITVKGGAFFSGRFGEPFTTVGEMRLVGATFALGVTFDSGHLKNPGGVALRLDRIHVTGNVFFQKYPGVAAFAAEGNILMGGCRVEGQVGFVGAQLQDDVNLQECRVSSLWLDFDQPPQRTILRNGDIGALYVTHFRGPVIVPRRMILQGLRYRTLDSMTSCDVSAHLRWIEEGQTDYEPQPYEQLAQVYAANGHEDEARRVLIAKQKRRRSAISLRGKVGSYFLGATVAHGYRSWQAGLWLLALLAVGTGLFDLVFTAALKDSHADFTPARASSQVPAFNALIYTLDVLLPVIDLGQATAWNAHGTAQWIAVTLALSGWLLTAALVAGIAARRR